MSFTYPFPRPSFTLDAIVFRPLPGDEEGLEVLLIKRGHEPFVGRWALPGGFLDLDEPLAAGAARELAEETGVTGLPLAPIFTSGEVGRDPRGRCITTVFGVLTGRSDLQPRGADDADEAAWFRVRALPAMAFDHERVLAQALAHLRWQARTAVIGRHVFSNRFSTHECLSLHRAILGPEDATAADALERGCRLGLIAPIAGTDDGWRFVIPAQPGPDWEALAW
jgi:8-oxo-dGTP diphosphatase